MRDGIVAHRAGSFTYLGVFVDDVHGGRRWGDGAGVRQGRVLMARGIKSGASRKDLQQRLRALRNVVQLAGVDARRAADAEYAAADHAVAEARAGATSRGDQARGVGEHVQSVVARQAPAAREHAAGLAPGLASMAADDPGWRSRDFYGSTTPAHLRVGSLDVPGADAPVVVPLLGTPGWAVSGKGAAAQPVIVSAALRLLASMEPHRVRVDAFDPRLSGAVGVLGQLTSRCPDIVPKPIHEPAGLHTVLSGLAEVSAARAARLSQAGFARFEQLARSTRSREAHRVLMMLDYPAGVTAEIQANLLRLAATGQDRGICLLVHHNLDVAPEHEVRPDDLLRDLTTVRINGTSATVSALPDVPIRLDARIAPDTVARACALIAEGAEAAVLPTIGLDELLPDAGKQWLPLRDELETTLGYADHTPVSVRFRSGNPALPHLLLGGSAGQGKSNLLMVLIHGLAARYSPADLAMYLLDFKHGVEFAPLGPAEGRPHFLPHIKVLGVHSDRTFGLAVLRHLVEDLTRRSEVFKKAGVSDIAAMPPGESRPPRLLVVLDEFQVLLDGDDDIADEAVTLIERLARLGRAYGVHLVLSTQTIEGVARLAQRRDAIFGQVPHRIALKTTPTDSQALLGAGNTAAARLQFRGEAIVNANFGNADDNQRALVAYADPTRTDALRRDLWVRAGGSLGVLKQPRVFDIDQPATLPDALRSQTPGRDAQAAPQAWAGLPITVSEEPATIPLRPEPGAGLLVLGNGPVEALGVLTSIAVTAAVAHKTPAGTDGASGTKPRFVLLDPTASDLASSPHKAALVEALTGLGCQVEVVARADAITPRLIALRDQIRESPAADPATPPTYVVGMGLHAVPRMKTHIGDTYESPADVLTEIVREGPTAGVITLGWWNLLQVCSDHLGYDRAGVAAHLFLKHPQDGVRSVCGPLVRWKSEPHRGLLWDGLHPEPRELVPFAPLGLIDVRAVQEGLAR